MDQLCAVITGDLIGSTAAPAAEVERAMGILRRVAEEQAFVTGAGIRFARFRGDGWQIYSPDSRLAFRLVMLVLAELRAQTPGMETRLALAIGASEVPDARDLAAARGEAFSLSGHALDAMAKSAQVVFVSKEPEQYWQRPLLSYLEWQASRWTREQAEALAIAFRADPPSPASVAGVLGISRQAAQARLKGAGYRPVAEAAQAFEAIVPFGGRHD